MRRRALVSGDKEVEQITAVVFVNCWIQNSFTRCCAGYFVHRTVKATCYSSSNLTAGQMLKHKK